MKRKISWLVAGICVFGMLSCGDKNGMAGPQTDLPNITISDIILLEGDVNNAFPFKVFLSAAFDQDVKVNYETQDWTAGGGEDYKPTSGTLTIPAGEKTGIIEIEVVGDTLKESDEQFRLTLTNPVNATIMDAQALGTIKNDDTFIDVPEEGYITPDNYLGYTRVWQDEFEGDQLNTNDWTHEIGAGGWGNQELQHYTDRPENSFLTDGNLIIEAKEEFFDGAPYTSARLITKGKKEFTWGRIDIRAILPEGQGIWPALWMLGSNIDDIGWPACGEIDIMELVGHEPGTSHGTGHWGEQGAGSTYKGNNHGLPDGEKFSDEYHVFSIIWENNSIEWFVDDNRFFTLTHGEVSGNYPFDKRFFFIFNIAVGGLWPGFPDETTVFPQQMIVDYIRVFEKQ